MTSQNPVFIPGPTNIPEILRKAVDMPTIDHRSPVFGRILHPALEGVKKVLKTTQGQVFVFPSTGTGGWETAITNTLSPGDAVLATRNGMFSHRWIDMCQRHGLDVQVDTTILATAVPSVVDDLGGFTQFPWLFSVYLLAQAVTVLLAWLLWLNWRLTLVALVMGQLGDATIFASETVALDVVGAGLHPQPVLLGHRRRPPRVGQRGPPGAAVRGRGFVDRVL